MGWGYCLDMTNTSKTVSEILTLIETFEAPPARKLRSMNATTGARTDRPARIEISISPGRIVQSYIVTVSSPDARPGNGVWADVHAAALALRETTRAPGYLRSKVMSSGWTYDMGRDLYPTDRVNGCAFRWIIHPEAA